MQRYFMELSGRSSSERLDNQREILTNGGDLPRDLGSGEPRNWDGEANLVVYKISELGTWPMIWQKFHRSLKKRVSVCPSLGVLLEMAQYLSVILIFAR